MSSARPPSSAENEQQQQKSYKEQLDEAAIKAKIHENDNAANQGGFMTTVVEKVSQYVPAIGKSLGQGQNDTPAQAEPSVPGPPERPHHDTQIEEFVRDQHRSRKEDGELVD